MFAAWPLLYAASFSGFYFAILLVLLAFIVRPVGFGFRNKIDDPRWRNGWDWVLTVSGLIPPLIFGVAFGNLFLGVPFRYDETLRMTYEGGLIGLLRPFPLLVGVVSLTMLLMHGAAWASLKADEIIAARATRLLSGLAPAFAVTYILAGVWLAFGIPGYVDRRHRRVQRTIESARERGDVEQRMARRWSARRMGLCRRRDRDHRRRSRCRCWRAARVTARRSSRARSRSPARSCRPASRCFRS